MLGAAFHGTFVFVGLTLQAQRAVPASHEAFAELLRSFSAAQTGLAIPAILGILLSSVWFGVVVSRKPTAYPRWTAMCNPLVFAILSIAVARAVPSMAFILAPITLNFSHVLFFICTTASVWRHVSQRRLTPV